MKKLEDSLGEARTGLLLLIILSMAILLVSCEETADPEESNDAELLKVTPAHDSFNIDPNAEITIEFGEGMDTLSCQSRFGVYHGELDEIPVNMMGQMRGMIAGDYYWNHDQTMMTFHPDSTLMDSAMYSICLQEGMQMHHHDREQTMGQRHMQGHGESVGQGIIVHFQTGGYQN